MEISCTRCHQTVEADDCYCATCGLPQLVYAADPSSGLTQPENWNEAVRDAGSVNWKPALRAALMLAVPAGLLSSVASPMAFMGLFWMAAAAAWTVVLYLRSQRPSWITIGAGARIGLVTGLLGSWLAFGASGGSLFVERFVLHQSSQIDELYKTSFFEPFQQKFQQSISSMDPSDAAQAQPQWAQLQAWLASPEGHAGMWAWGFAFNSAFLLFFAIAGGALGARILARTRRPEV
ncbi:MAG: hypothetical protein ABSE46_02030 [Terracidiphilus sp.]|jgi:hypothetical protein